MLLVRMSERWRTRPSRFLQIEDELTAYCIDETATILLAMMEDGKEPKCIKNAKHKASLDNSLKKLRQRGGKFTIKGK